MRILLTFVLDISERVADSYVLWNVYYKHLLAAQMCQIR